MNHSELNLKHQAVQKFQDMTGLSAEQTNEIFDMFFDSLSDNRAKLIEYMKSYDYPCIFQIAHKLRGTSGSLMIDDIFKLSDMLEKKAKVGDEKSIELTAELVKTLELYLD